MTSPLQWRGAEVCRAGVDFYRLRSSGTKVSVLRPIAYTVLGYAVGASWEAPSLLVSNAAVMVCLLAFFGAYGNYWDWRLHGEQNTTGAVIERYRLGVRMGWWLTWLPWAGIAPGLIVLRAWGFSTAAQGLIGAMVLLGVLYSTPAIRLKARRGAWLVAPVVACLLFLEGALVHEGRSWDLTLLILTGLLGLFQCQAEFLHLLDDGFHHAHEPLPCPLPRLLVWLRRLPVISLAASLAAACASPVFLNTTLWSLVRMRAIKRLSAADLPRLTQVRTNVLRHPIWSVWEFAIYAAVGIWSRVA